jgi:predicted phage tail protein
VGNVLTYNVVGLASNTTYYYRVRAVNSIGNSANSSVITATTLLTIPSSPIALAASSIGSTGFTANWSASATATGYRLDISTNNSFSTYVSGYQNLDVSNLTNRAVVGLSFNTTYYYRVRSYNAAGTSVSSGVVGVTTKKKSGGNGLISYRQGNIEVIDGEDHIHAVYVFNSSGALLFSANSSKKQENVYRFYCPELAGQLILIKLVSADGTETERILVMK